MKRREFINQLVGGLAASAIPLNIDKSFGASSEPPFVLRIHCDGGWDQTCVFDNKSNSNVVAVETAQTLGVGADGINYVSHGSRPNVDAFFAVNGGQACIVNGIFCEGIERQSTLESSMGVLINEKTRYITDYLEFYSRFAAKKKTAGHLVFNAPYFPGEEGGRSYFIDSEVINRISTAPTNVNTISTAAETKLQEYLESHYKDFVKGMKKDGIDYRKAVAINEARVRNTEISESVLEALQATNNAADSDLLNQAKAALYLFEAGLSQSATVRAGNNLAWDTVADNFLTQSALFNSLFGDLSQIIAYAESIGVSENLMILVTSESGRSPTLNSLNGKDRWSYTSLLAWGKYIRPAAVVGKTDEYLRGVPLNPEFGTEEGETDPITMRNVFAALYFAAAINYSKLLSKTNYLSLMIKLR